MCALKFDRVSTISALNESPSEKEGKFQRIFAGNTIVEPSMKVPPKRKGNVTWSAGIVRTP